MVEGKRNDSVSKTLLVVLVLCLVCAVVVSGAAVGLKTHQQEQRLLDKQRNILGVAGLITPGMSNHDVLSTFHTRITPRLVDLNSGALLEQAPAQFDAIAALKDPAQRRLLDAEHDPAGIKWRSNIVEIYLVRDADRTPRQLILPIYGNGLWSMMHAFVALEPDGRTVRGIAYYEHGETPGLGGEVENPRWRQQWVGKKLLDDQGNPAIRVMKGSAPPDDPVAVDGLSGATLTARGVQHSFDFWLGDLGFGPFLKRVREGELNNG